MYVCTWLVSIRCKSPCPVIIYYYYKTSSCQLSGILSDVNAIGQVMQTLHYIICTHNHYHSCFPWSSVPANGPWWFKIAVAVFRYRLNALLDALPDLPHVINGQFCKFAAALLGPVHFLLPDQQSGIYCLIICAIQLLTPNNLGGTLSCICLPDVQNISALKASTFTYLLTHSAKCTECK